MNINTKKYSGNNPDLRYTFHNSGNVFAFKPWVQRRDKMFSNKPRNKNLLLFHCELVEHLNRPDVYILKHNGELFDHKEYISREYRAVNDF